MPTIEHAIKDSALDMLMRIVEAGREADRKKDVEPRHLLHNSASKEDLPSLLSK